MTVGRRSSRRSWSTKRRRARAIGDAAVKSAAVVTLPIAQAGTRTYGIDPSVEAVAAFTYLPLHGAGWATRKSNRHGTVVLRAAVSLRRTGGGEVAADVAGVELDRIQTGVRVEPGRPGGVQRGDAGVDGPVNAAIVAHEQDVGRVRQESERVLVHVNGLGRYRPCNRKWCHTMRCRYGWQARYRRCQRRRDPDCSGRPRLLGRTSSVDSRRYRENRSLHRSRRRTRANRRQSRP